MHHADKPLFIFELANNHMGDVAHGLRVIGEFGAIARDFPEFRFAFKFQFRDLDTFIHPDYRDRHDFKYVKRFSETRLSREAFATLKDAAAEAGFMTLCTPFDEPSVDMIEDLGFDAIKIASCSFTDWPLLERVVQSHKPLIASTAGVPLEDIDKVVSFFEHREKDFALMHCVADYPTAPEGLQLNQIDLFRQRYAQHPIGFSTHESPDYVAAVQMAVAKGATLFEKHIGVPTERYALNAYSADPEQTRRWLEAAREAFAVCGVSGARMPFSASAVESLHSLRRGAFARRPVAAGERIALADLAFAIPTFEGQLTANDMSKYVEYRADQAIAEGAPIMGAEVTATHQRDRVYAILQDVKRVIAESRVAIPSRLDWEISHHYGLERFFEFGATIVTFINRHYCKKLIILTPGQAHPEQYHKIKEETFHILHGEVTIALDGEERAYGPGDFVLVPPHTRHHFRSETGAVIEEISSTHYADDSYYVDPAIMANPSRKTLLTHWID